MVERSAWKCNKNEALLFFLLFHDYIKALSGFLKKKKAATENCIFWKTLFYFIFIWMLLLLFR